MDRGPAAQIWHLATAAVGAFGLVAQLILVFAGESVLVTEDPPGLGERLLHFISYFTVQANIVIFAAVIRLARDPAHDGSGWRVLRLAGLVGITVTGIVHWFFLRPLLNLSGWSYATDKLLHVVVPIMVVLGWLAFGPRPRINLRVVLLALIWPVAWLAYTLLLGAVTGWYPYPFVNVDTQGVGPVAIACVAIAVAFFALAGLAALGDRRLAARPVSSAR